VLFLGFRDWEQLPAIYQGSDILCAPSRYDGWNMAIPEGLAAGMPTIGTTRTGAALELIHAGNNGWLVDAGSLEGLYGRMRQAALMDRHELEKSSLCARESVRDHSLTNGAYRFVEAVRNTLEQHIQQRSIKSWKSERLESRSPQIRQ